MKHHWFSRFFNRVARPWLDLSELVEDGETTKAKPEHVRGSRPMRCYPRHPHAFGTVRQYPFRPEATR